MLIVNYDWDEVEDNIMAEHDVEGDLIARYTTEPTLYGNVISQFRDRATSYFHHDGIGNTTEVTDDDGDVTDTRRYSAFGETTESSGTTEFPFQYVGQKGYYRDDETGEYSVRRRVYEPVTSRWLSVDPAGYGDGFNLYQYVRGNTLGYIDPSGEFMVWHGCKCPRGGECWGFVYCPESTKGVFCTSRCVGEVMQGLCDTCCNSPASGFGSPTLWCEIGLCRCLNRVFSLIRVRCDCRNCF